MTDKSARVEYPSEETTAVSDVAVSRERDGYLHGADWVLGPVLSTEAGLDYSAGFCEVGALGSLVRIGAELRCALVQQDNGAPLSIAGSSAVLYPVDVFDELPRARTGFRAGLDTSRQLASWSPLVGLYVEHGMQSHALLDHDLPDEDMFVGNFPPAIHARRREWRVSLPLGVEIGRRGGTATFGLVPEYTFAVADDATAEFETGLGRVLAFDRRWAVFLTISGALTL